MKEPSIILVVYVRSDRMLNSHDLFVVRIAHPQVLLILHLQRLEGKFPKVVSEPVHVHKLVDYISIMMHRVVIYLRHVLQKGLR